MCSNNIRVYLNIPYSEVRSDHKRCKLTGLKLLTCNQMLSLTAHHYLMPLLELSGSWAETLPIEVPTLASSETTILLSGEEKTGGSLTSSTVTLTDVVSLNGPKLKKLESIFLFVASILREKLLFVSKSRG